MNKEKKKAKDRRYYLKYQERLKEKAKQYYYNNKEKVLKRLAVMSREYKNEIRYGGNKFKTLERDHYMCINCGTKEKLLVHHIDESGWEGNNNMDNLITLCISCHISLHKKGDYYEARQKEKCNEVYN